MTENTINRQLEEKLKPLLPGFVIFKHSDRARIGIPDFSIIGRNFTSWWEVKLADPDFDSVGIQELTCLRLAVAGYCRYIIFDYSVPAHPTTSIVHPKDLKNWKRAREKMSVGLAYHMLSQHIRSIHI